MADSLIKADIFFFIATFSLALVTIGFIVAMVYIIKILRDVKYVSRRAKEETDKVVKELSLFRSFLKKLGVKSKFKKFFRAKRGTKGSNK